MWKTAAIVVGLAVVIFGAYQVFHTNHVTKGPVTVAFTGVDTSCDQCETRADKALSKILGIESAHIDTSKDAIRVTFNSKKMKADWIKHSLNAAGFHPDDVKVLSK